MREEQGKEEEEQQEMDDLFLPQCLTRLSSAWNDITAGFCGNRALAHTHVATCMFHMLWRKLNISKSKKKCRH